MNTAVLMLTACLPGQAPYAPAPYAAPYPYLVPAQYAAYPAPGFSGGYGPGYGGNCCGSGQWGGGGSNCCGHASVDCGGDTHSCCLLHKIKEKLSCFRLCCDKGNACDKGPVCPKPCPPPCPPKPVCNPCPPKPVCQNPCPPKPACNPCPKPACNPAPACPKPTCCKVEPVCHDHCFKICWTPGYCLHKCKEKLAGLCEGGHSCHGGCGTAATPNACGSTVITPAPGMVVPAPVAPPTPAPKTMPDAKKIGSNYGPVQVDLAPAAATAPRVIDLAPPF